MFWKKGDNSGLDISLEEVDRSAHRVRPLSGEPIILMIDGQPCRVHDISAGGALFQSPRKVVAGDVKELKFKLPFPELLIEGRIRIVAADQDLARGSFLDLEEETMDQIHLYVLETQKRRLKDTPRSGGAGQD